MFIVRPQFLLTLVAIIVYTFLRMPFFSNVEAMIFLFESSICLIRKSVFLCILISCLSLLSIFQNTLIEKQICALWGLQHNAQIDILGYSRSFMMNSLHNNKVRNASFQSRARRRTCAHNKIAVLIRFFGLVNWAK